MLILDDGTFDIGNTFVELIEADTYHSNRLTDSWLESSVTDAQKESALIRAFDYLYVQDWKAGVFDIEIPVRVKRAQMVAASKELESPGSLQEDQDKHLKRKRLEGVVDKEYFKSDPDGQVVFTEIMNLLKPYLRITETVDRSRRLVRM
jgi:hypothetical protein